MQKVQTLLVSVLATFFIHCIFTAQGQSDISAHPKDSIDYKFIFSSIDDSVGVGSKNNTNFIQVFENPRLFELSAGMSFLNILRGQTPDLNISPPFITGNPIAHNYLLVIDDIPYNSDIAYFVNLNAFDFDRVVVLSPVNGASDFGMVGGNGGTLLRRKSGRCINGPQLEFNSFSTLGWYAPDNSPFNPKDRVQLSNSLSFAEDFGKIDTRLSFNHTVIPARDDNAGALASSIKMNTGWQFLPKLNGTIIFERHKQNAIQPKVAQSFLPNGESNFRTAGLELEYSPLNWLSLTARAMQDELNFDNRFDVIRDFFGSSAFRNNQKRGLVKYTLRMKHLIRDKLRINPAISYQQDNIEYKLDMPNTLTQQGTHTIKSVWGGINSIYKDAITLDLSYRMDDNNFVKDKKISTSSISVGWNFTKLLSAQDLISYGRLRSNFGYRNGSAPHPVVQVFQEASNPSFYRFYSSQSGIDLSMFKNRIQLTYSHYLIFDKSFREEIIQEGRYIINYQDYTKDAIFDGDEIIIGSYPLGTKDWYVKLIWSRPDLSNFSWLPDWIGSIYLMRDWNGFQLSTLVTYQKGGQIFANNRSYSASAVGLRDLSLSHKAFLNTSGRFGLREVMLSLSARNLMRLAASGAGNLELNGVSNGMYNSFTLNILGKLY